MPNDDQPRPRFGGDFLFRTASKAISPCTGLAMKPDRGAHFQISIDGVPRTYRDRKDIAFLKSRNPNSTVTLRDLQTGEEIVVAFKAEQQ
jgi:hypothetical protein